MISTKSGNLTERTEILFDPTTKAWAETAARVDGRTLSGWVRMLVDRELTSKYPQYHPGGDQGDDEV